MLVRSTAPVPNAGWEDWAVAGVAVSHASAVRRKAMFFVDMTASGAGEREYPSAQDCRPHFVTAPERLCSGCCKIESDLACSAVQMCSLCVPSGDFHGRFFEPVK